MKNEKRKMKKELRNMKNGKKNKGETTLVRGAALQSVAVRRSTVNNVVATISV